jgi:hypothetical protein
LLSFVFVAACPSNLAAPNGGEEKALREAVGQYFKYWKRGEVDQMLAMYDPRSWQQLSKEKYKAYLVQQVGNLFAYPGWTIEKLAIYEDAGYARCLLDPKRDAREHLLWVRRRGQWFLTLDSWQGRNREPRIWEDYRKVVRLNNIRLEPQGDYRETVVAKTREAICAFDSGDCQRLVGLMTSVSMLDGDSSWDIPYYLQQGCEHGWGPKGLPKLRPLDAISVAWKSYLIDTGLAKVPGTSPRDLSLTKLSCWEVFVPFVEQEKGSSVVQGIVLRWVRTPDGLRLCEIRHQGLTPI